MSDPSSKSSSGGTDFSGQDLKKRRFKSENLAGADFSGADLTRARFTDCDLTGANFTKANLTGARFSGGLFAKVCLDGVNGARVRFSKVDWVEVTATDADLSNISLNKVKISGGKFASTKLGRAALYRVDIGNTTFETCDLDYTEAPEAKLSQVSIKGSSCKFVDLVSSSFVDCTLEESSFSETVLSGSTFKNSSFVKCNFERAEMIACDFDQFTFESCEFTKATVKLAKGLTEDQRLTIKEAGGRLGLDLGRKSWNFLIHSNVGRILLAGMVLAVAAYAGYRMFVPTSWSYFTLKAKAEKAMSDQEPETARKFFLIVLDKWGSDPSRAAGAQLMLGEIAINQKQDEEAEKRFLAALDVAPEFSGTRMNANFGLARVYQSTDQSEKAAEAANEVLKSVENTPENIFLYFDAARIRAESLEKLGRIDEAIATIKPLVDSQDENIVRHVLGMLQHLESQRGGDGGNVEALIAQVQEKFPEQAESMRLSLLANQAQQLMNQGKHAQGEKLYLEISEKAEDPGVREGALWSLAEYYTHTKRDLPRAETMWTRMQKDRQERGLNNTEINLSLAYVYRMMKKPEKERELLEKAIAQSEQWPEARARAYQSRARLYESQKKYDAALADLKQATQYMTDPQARFGTRLMIIGYTSKVAGPDQAVADLKKLWAEKIPPEAVTADLTGINILGESLNDPVKSSAIQEKHLKKLIGTLKSAGVADNRYSGLLVNLGWLYKGQENVAEARNQWEAAILSSKGEPELGAFEGMILSYMDANDFGSALQQINRLVEAISSPHALELAERMRAEMYVRQQEPEKAVEVLTKAMDKCEGNQGCCGLVDGMVGVYESTQDPDAMKKLLQQTSQSRGYCGWQIERMTNFINEAAAKESQPE
jgi:uncharacterized protein YjbI with pentapeptide repeats/tetratricopeptide (TPR) repeat protein